MTELFQEDVGEKRRKCLSYGQWEVILPITAVKVCKREEDCPSKWESIFLPPPPPPKSEGAASSAYGHITHTCTQTTYACHHMLPHIEKGVISLDLKLQQAL